MNPVKQLNLGDLDAEAFLRQYWQKRPLLIRQALPGFQPPISPEELAGLACEANVEARLVLEKSGKKPWQVKHGPFDEQDFADLPESHWSLLVQAVDQHVPEVADLLDYFQFIPNWRVDDLMVSFAPPQGSVGPHTDSYDVFLIQAYGRRRWDIREGGPGHLLPGLDMKILAEFSPEQSWELEPGDILYLPPHVAHHGVALSDCMTFSVGFLAPSQAELIGHYVDEALLQLDPAQRYADPDLALQAEPGELSPRAREKVRALVRSLPLDDASLDAWFGRYISQPRAGAEFEPLQPPLSPSEWLEEFEQHGHLRRHSRALFMRDATTQSATLFVNGESFPLTPSLAYAAPMFSQQRDFEFTQMRGHLDDAALVALLCDLTNRGLCYFYAEDSETELA